MNKRFISFFFFSLLFLMFFLNFFTFSVFALVTYSTSFEGGVLGDTYSDAYYVTSGDLVCSNVMNRTGSRNVYIDFYEVGNISFDSSNLVSGAIINKWLCYLYNYNPALGADTLTLTYYNKTLGYSKPIIQIRETSFIWYYRDNNGVYQTLLNNAAYRSQYVYISFELLNNLGDCRYESGSSGAWPGFTVDGTVYNTTAVNLNYTIDKLEVLYTAPATCYVRVDDVSITADFSISTSDECVDYTGYYDVNHIRDYQALSVLPTACKYLEFQNWYEMTANLYGFEFLVDSQQLEKDSALNHYGLFINGFFAGNPICNYQYDGDRTSLQWDFTDNPIFIDNERIIFEMYHDNVPSGSYAWYLPIEYNTVFPPVPSEIYYYSDTSHIDGLISYSDMSLREHKLSWRLFFNLGVNTTVDCDYTNTILLKDSSGNSLANHPVYNIPFSYPYRTIYFNVFVNDTSEYSLNVYRQGVPVGFTQYYPKDMTLCDGVYGFTPLNSGNYTVSLYDGDGYFLNQTFNITHIDTSFAIWTYPNPSLQQSSVTIGVYAENPNKYANYSIGLSYNITLLNTFDTSKLSQVFYIPGFIGNYYYLETEMLFQYIRLFATNGTVYIPITPVYNHKILSADTTNTIDTTLGDDDSGITNLEFFVWGKYRSSPIGTAKIYRNSEYVGTTQYGTFSFSQIIQTPGTYTYSLREYVGNSYTVLASVTITITDVTTPQDSDIQLDFGLFINTILGLLLVLLLTLSPAIVTIWLAQKSNITNINIPGLLYVAMFLLGIIVSCIIGWFPLWVLLFVIIGLALTVFILWLRSKSESD